MYCPCNFLSIKLWRPCIRINMAFAIVIGMVLWRFRRLVWKWNWLKWQFCAISKVSEGRYPVLSVDLAAERETVMSGFWWDLCGDGLMSFFAMCACDICGRHQLTLDVFVLRIQNEISMKVNRNFVNSVFTHRCCVSCYAWNVIIKEYLEYKQ